MKTATRAAAALAVIASLPLAARAQEGCTALKALRLPDTTILVAESRVAGEEAFAAQGVPGQPAVATQANLPAHCRVLGSIHPTPDSDIRFELWLPTQDWNHRYQQVGNGGLAGAIVRTTLIGPLQQHWAVAATDDGHVGASMSDGRWALGHPQKVIDFGYRAVHLTAQRSQAIINAYYGTAAAHRYFVGCSDGGRESLMEAQRYPEDFDGFVAGAAATDIPVLAARQVGTELGQQFFGYLVYGNPALDASKLDPVQAIRDAEARLGRTLNPSSTDLHKVRDSGKKIIQYHGLADPLIPAEMSQSYFRAVQAASGNTRDFYRLFLVPGMGHCGGGAGPTWIAGNAVRHDSAHDVVVALTHWVEDGVTPDHLVASGFKGPVADPLNGPPAGTPVVSRRTLNPEN